MSRREANLRLKYPDSQCWWYSNNSEIHHLHDDDDYNTLYSVSVLNPSTSLGQRNVTPSDLPSTSKKTSPSSVYTVLERDLVEDKPKSDQISFCPPSKLKSSNSYPDPELATTWMEASTFKVQTLDMNTMNPLGHVNSTRTTHVKNPRPVISSPSTPNRAFLGKLPLYPSVTKTGSSGHGSAGPNRARYNFKKQKK